MPFSSGTYTGLANSFNDAVSGTIIDPLDWNALFTDIETAINSLGAAVASVKAYGAKGDGATDDTSAIQAAITAVAAAGGGRVWFPRGGYIISSGLTVNTANCVELVGESWQSTILQVSASSNIRLLYLNAGRHVVRGLTLIGSGVQGIVSTSLLPTAVGATSYAIHLGSSAVDCLIDHCSIGGGYYCIYNQSADVTLSDVIAQSAVGPAIIKNAGNGVWIRRGKFDQAYPYAFPGSSGITAPGARANATPYVAGNIVTLSGFYLQCTVGGTSAGSAPALRTYGLDITDGSVTWRLMSRVGSSSLLLDTDSGEVHCDQTDITGCWDYCISLQNNASGTAPFYSYFGNCVISQALSRIVDAGCGNTLHMWDNTIGGTVTTAANVIDLYGSFAHTALFTGNLIGNSGANGNGIAVRAGTKVTIQGNAFEGLDRAVSVNAGISGWSVGGNGLGGRSGVANNYPVVIESGASDYYSVLGNTYGDAANDIVDLGTGYNKTIQTKSGSLGIGITPASVSTLSATPRLHLGATSGDVYAAVTSAAAVAGLGIVGATSAQLMLVDAGASSSQKVWNAQSDGGVLSIRLLNDTSTGVVATPVTFNNAGLSTFASAGIAISGSSSGTVTHKAAATAGSNTITWPAGTTDFSGTGGTSQVVKQTSSGGALTVATLAASDIASGQTLSRTNDTNVTLTLGGSPTTALLAAASLTLGWTGTLGVARGGIGTGTAGVGAFNNVTGLSAAGFTGTTSTYNVVLSNAPTLTSPVISGGTIDNAPIGGTTQAAGAFTTLDAKTSIGAYKINGTLLVDRQNGGGGAGDYTIYYNSSGGSNMVFGVSDPTNYFYNTKHQFQTTNVGTVQMFLSGAGGLSVNNTSDAGAGMIYTNSASFMIRTKTSYNNGVAAQTATMTNGPTAGNPSKWIPVDDNGTTRYIPAW